MTFELPNLRILPTEKLVPHEWHDEQRAKPLIERLRASGVLRNPPVVSPFDDASQRYMVLDGANRSVAFKQMGIPHILAQVVPANDPGLELHTWNHVLWNWDTQKFLESVQKIEGISLRQIDPAVKRPQSRWPQKTLVWLQTPKGDAFIARSQPEDLSSRVRKLVQISDCYMSKAQLDRTMVQQVSELNGKPENLTALVVYPPFKPTEVLELCKQGILLPPGITRFTISPRALRVNYPLDELSSNKSIEAKNEALVRWVNERVARKGVRNYAEATVLYDE